MLDREKVLRGLECCAAMSGEECRKCPYGHECRDTELPPYGIPHLAADALILLREQEPVEPKGEDCGECGYTLHRINYDGPDKGLRHEWFRFCPSCGKAVKW